MTSTDGSKSDQARKYELSPTTFRGALPHDAAALAPSILPPGPLPGEGYTSFSPDPSADALNAKNANEAGTDYSNEILLWPTIDDNNRAFSGPLGAVVKYFTADAEAHPVAVLLHVLVGFGNLIGRERFAMGGSSRHYTNEHAVIVGPSSAGKGEAWNEAEHILSLLAPEWCNDRIYTDLSSGEGVITLVQDGSVEDKRLMAVIPEFSSYLKKANRQDSTLSEIFRQSWESGYLQNNNKRSPARATNAHVSIVGHTTPDDLRRQFGSGEATNGFGNRILWLAIPPVPEHRLKPGRVRPGNDGVREYIEKLRASISQADKPASEMARSAAATELFGFYYQWLHRGIDHPRAQVNTLLHRARPHVLRLSMMYAIADGSLIIRSQDVASALALWAYIVDSVCFLFGGATTATHHDQAAAQVLSAIRAHPDGITQTELNKQMGNHPSKTHAATEQLYRSGQIACRSQPRPRGGRPTTVWYVPQPKTASFASFASFDEVCRRGHGYTALFAAKLKDVPDERSSERPVLDEIIEHADENDEIPF